MVYLTILLLDAVHLATQQNKQCLACTHHYQALVTNKDDLWIDPNLRRIDKKFKPS